MRSLKDIYPEFADSVDFYAVNFATYESIDSVAKFARKQGWTFPVAQGDRDMFVAFDVTYQSTKVAFDRNGVIVYRDGFGRGNAGKWRQVFEELES